MIGEAGQDVFDRFLQQDKSAGVGGNAINISALDGGALIERNNARKKSVSFKGVRPRANLFTN